MSLTDVDEARLLAAVRKDRGASFSHWLVSLGLKRADELGVPEEVPLPRKPARKKSPG